MRRLYFAILPLLLACSGPSSRGQAEQPIQYNHNLHVVQEEIDCDECHRYAATHARATIPNIEVCGDCHSDEPITDSPEEARLIEYVDGGEKIPWRKVYRVDDHVYFSHRRHTTLAGIECAECHGNVESMTTPVVESYLPTSMEGCIKCHEERGAATECVACHR